MYIPPLHNAREILSRLKTGDERAFEEVYRSRYLAIFTLVKRLVDNQQAAEDITTDTFFKCWQRRGDFDEPGRLDAFLHTTARNASLNYLRDYQLHRKKKAALAAARPEELQPDLAEHEVTTRIYEYISRRLPGYPPTCRRSCAGISKARRTKLSLPNSA